MEPPLPSYMALEQESESVIQVTEQTIEQNTLNFRQALEHVAKLSVDYVSLY